MELLEGAEPGEFVVRPCGGTATNKLTITRKVSEKLFADTSVDLIDQPRCGLGFRV